ncbi:DNA N-6-adenine-methyltransferase [Nannocystis sp. ILAH1]|uniref:DNA N-6-adenine-methyltransferase n=1 Tax=Nannocystis sp. ILAH1 TaxID=2996789 RepID=UPI00226D48B7|nr:DNA N-6-adenine-methyltransferase [Nannocystis sp. ILAH1]
MTRASTDSDRYFTPQELLDLVLAQWGAIDLDPCWDPESAVIAEKTYDIRQQQDGLLLPWSGKVWLNPPYSNTSSWIVRAAQHAAAGGEVLALVQASVGSSYWRSYVWPWASVCCLSPRPKFGRPAALAATKGAMVDHAVVYYGPNHDEFARVWCIRGEIVASARGPKVMTIGSRPSGL